MKDMTLEDRLMTYDWKSSFQKFQEATHLGSFKPLCSNSKGLPLPDTKTTMESHYPRILHAYHEAKPPCSRKPLRNKLSMLLSEDGDIRAPVDPESDEANAVERGQLVRNKVSRSSEGPVAGSSGARAASVALFVSIIAAVLNCR